MRCNYSLQAHLRDKCGIYSEGYCQVCAMEYEGCLVIDSCDEMKLDWETDMNWVLEIATEIGC